MGLTSCQRVPIATTVALKRSSEDIEPLSAGAFSVRAARPAARTPLTLFQFLLGTTNATRPGHLLLGVFYPADELVACEGGDVLPGIESRGIRHQGGA